MREFWSYLERLLAEHQLVIDRPRGSGHPRFPEQTYPLDYGYLEGTTAGDGHGIDVWRGSLAEPLLDALLLTIDLYKRDAEIKLLLGCSAQDLRKIRDFTNDDKMRSLILPRNPAALMHERRSVRHFEERPVEQALIERLLAAAAQAPSAHNRQPWRFAVLTSLESRKSLAFAIGAEFRRDLLADGVSPDDAEAQLNRSQERICQAPLAILLCVDGAVLDAYPDERRQQAELLMGVQSAAMAAENLLLAAQAEGLGGVWLCAPLFAQDVARLALKLPQEWQPQGLLLIGYPAGRPPSRVRWPLEDVSIFL